MSDACKESESVLRIDMQKNELWSLNSRGSCWNWSVNPITRQDSRDGEQLDRPQEQNENVSANVIQPASPVSTQLQNVFLNEIEQQKTRMVLYVYRLNVTLRNVIGVCVLDHPNGLKQKSS